MPRSTIGKDELLGYLQKAKVLKPTAPTLSLTAGLEEGRISTSPAKVDPTRSVMLNPSTRFMGWRGNQTVQPNRHIEYKVLRRISEKAWLINTIITHQQNKIRPFLKPSTDLNIRGFQLRVKDPDAVPNEAQKQRLKDMTQFIIKTGWGPDPERRDDLVHFGMKFVRDYMTLDQIATELQRTVSRKLFAYWAIDPATIIRCTESGYEGNDEIRYVQEIDMVPTAYYTDDDLIFDYGNPRTDIDHAGYGYSLTEQAIDLILAQINAFWYNASAMTEDNLPRGMILLNGDADLETVEAIEEYIIDIMSAGPQSKWKIPIVPSGMVGGGESSKKALEWVNFRNTNREQEYVEWTDHLWSAVAALFGVDLEELGIRTKKSGPVLNDNVTPRIEESKSRGLSSILSVLENHIQKIIDKTGDDWIDFEFVGYEREDPKAKSDLREAELRTYKSIDELRIEADLKPYNEDWSTIPLNPSVVQMKMSADQAAQMGGGMGMPGQGPEGDEEYKNMMFGEEAQQEKPKGDGWEDDPGGGDWGDPEAKNAWESEEEPIQKSIGDDIVEIVI